MVSTFVLAQQESSGDPAENLKKAQQAVAKAMELYHPDFMVFPEIFMSHFHAGTDRKTILSEAQTLDGPFVTGMRALAKENGIWIAFGMNEAVEDENDDRNYNTVVFVNSDGELVTAYHKTHPYDAFGFKESDTYKSGDTLFEPLDTPFGRIGLFTCYEVRFPEIARDQTIKGAEIILMPTAWMRGDLKSLHFRTLISARAIENTVFVLACDQSGHDCIGESVAVDPMGVAFACGGEGDELICARVDLDRIAEVRKKLPSYDNRRPELYGNIMKK